jgi:vacuolar-type H+-ATPase subunit I/STV1
MKRAELEKLGIAKEQVDAIMALHGQSVEEIRKSGETSAAEAARLQKELKEAGKAIEGFKALDVDGIKKAADDYKAKLEKSEAERATEKAQYERQTSAKEILAGMKPKSELVKKAALSDLMAAMDDPKFKADKWTK